ncbi:MAG: helix-turn-helix domain-containing protein, partial [Dehalococcoidales bacterium]|nr:helix-turn-helix domain-containing protein [Dehalococcoidales bacterium]
MRIISGVIPGASRLTKLQVGLSKKARQRLKWFDYYNSHNYNARLACCHFDISPQTFYRWKKRYNPHRLESLEERSRRLRHLRQHTYSVELIEAVL